jgi:ATP/maltotriose-dependent transcriptional regulator MalT
VTAATVQAQYLFFLGRCSEAVTLLARTQERARSAGMHEHESDATWWELAAMFFGPTPVSAAERRIAELETVPEKGRAVHAGLMRTRGRFAAIQGRFDEARELMQRWTEIERELGRSVRLASEAGHYTGPLEMAAGRFPEAVEAFTIGYEALTALGDRGYSSTTAAGLAHALIEVDDLDEAERYARTALDTATRDDFEPQVAASGALAVVLARRGDINEAITLAEQTVALARTSDYLMTLADALIDLGRVLSEAGRGEETLAAVDEAIELLERKEAWALVERARGARTSLA